MLHILLCQLCLSLSLTFRGYASQICIYSEASAPIASLLCTIEKNADSIVKKIIFPEDNVLCLLGTNKCSFPRKIPTQTDVKKSTDLPEADNKEYQRLSIIAERAVPAIWWREAFDDPLLLLTPHGDNLPKKLLLRDKQQPNRKLRNLNNCLCRQNIIRIGFGNESIIDMGVSKRARKKLPQCRAEMDDGVARFKILWDDDGGRMGGTLGRDGAWVLDMSAENASALYEAAKNTMDYFYSNAGGIWTGCIKVAQSSYCRGALAAASLLSSIRLLSEVAVGSTNTSNVEEIGSLISEGFLLASIGRSLMHGSSSDSSTPITHWHVKLSDFTAIQAIFLRIYTDSFGFQYTAQLNKYIPFAFHPSFPVYANAKWKSYSSRLEPVYSSLRNLMFTEANNLIDFGPYVPLISFPDVRNLLKETNNRRILIDIGANGFLASPKYLIDSYALYLPFTHVIMIEPEPHFSASVPASYSSKYNITFLQIYVEVNTGSKTDVISLLLDLVSADDFVVLKFDVDPNKIAKGPTMEWGFLFSLMSNELVTSLVDELYVELHFNFPDLSWKHYHSNWEALDLLRHLRDQGVIVHCWP